MKAGRPALPKMVKVSREELQLFGDAITQLGHAVWLLAMRDIGALNRRRRAARRKRAA
jgi:hypothetical protein